MDTIDKYPDGFTVVLDFIVAPVKQSALPVGSAATAKSCPWQGFNSKGLLPKVLFSSQEEYQQVVAEFGKIGNHLFFVKLFNS